MVMAKKPTKPVAEIRYWIRVDGRYLFGADHEDDFQFMARPWTTWDAQDVQRLRPALEALGRVEIEEVEEELVSA